MHSSLWPAGLMRNLLSLLPLEIAENLEIDLSKSFVGKFPDGEIKIQVTFCLFAAQNDGCAAAFAATLTLR